MAPTTKQILSSSNIDTQCLHTLDVAPHGITPVMLQNWGFLAWRYLPDGEVMGILPMTFGKGRLCSGLSNSGYEDCWCYPSVEAALVGMHQFNPQTEKEPTGWHRHPMSGRRREDCDPAKEQRYF